MNKKQRKRYMLLEAASGLLQVKGFFTSKKRAGEMASSISKSGSGKQLLIAAVAEDTLLNNQVYTISL